MARDTAQEEVTEEEISIFKPPFIYKHRVKE